MCFKQKEVRCQQIDHWYRQWLGGGWALVMNVAPNDGEQKSLGTSHSNAHSPPPRSSPIMVITTPRRANTIGPWLGNNVGYNNQAFWTTDAEVQPPPTPVAAVLTAAHPLHQRTYT